MYLRIVYRLNMCLAQDLAHSKSQQMLEEKQPHSGTLEMEEILDIINS